MGPRLCDFFSLTLFFLLRFLHSQMLWEDNAIRLTKRGSNSRRGRGVLLVQSQQTVNRGSSGSVSSSGKSPGDQLAHLLVALLSSCMFPPSSCLLSVHSSIVSTGVQHP